MAKNKNFSDVASGLFTQSEESLEKGTTTTQDSHSTTGSAAPVDELPLFEAAPAAKRGAGRRCAPDIVGDKANYKRQTYEISDDQIQALAIYAAKNRMTKSQVIRMLIDKL